MKKTMLCVMIGLIMAGHALAKEANTPMDERIKSFTHDVSEYEKSRNMLLDKEDKLLIIKIKMAQNELNWEHVEHTCDETGPKKKRDDLMAGLDEVIARSGGSGFPPDIRARLEPLASALKTALQEKYEKEKQKREARCVEISRARMKTEKMRAAKSVILSFIHTLMIDSDTKQAETFLSEFASGKGGPLKQELQESNSFKEKGVVIDIRHIAFFQSGTVNEVFSDVQKNLETCRKDKVLNDGVENVTNLIHDLDTHLSDTGAGCFVTAKVLKFEEQEFSYFVFLIAADEFSDGFKVVYMTN